jgi:hypothetical protein
LGSHWVVKIVVMIACVVGFGVLGAGIGIPAAFIAFEMGALGGGGGSLSPAPLGPSFNAAMGSGTMKWTSRQVNDPGSVRDVTAD